MTAQLSIKQKLSYLMRTEGITKCIRKGIEATPANLDSLPDEGLIPILSDIENLYKQSYAKNVEYPDSNPTNSFKNPNFHLLIG
jgi:hypothetical protein